MSNSDLLAERLQIFFLVSIENQRNNVCLISILDLKNVKVVWNVLIEKNILNGHTLLVKLKVKLYQNKIN